jgi:deazaflavin-dependent oxidoreductase (nitroreductase family)
MKEEIDSKTYSGPFLLLNRDKILAKKNNPKSKKTVSKKRNRRSAAPARASSGRKFSSTRATSRVLDTYNEWISRQVRTKRNKQQSSREVTERLELPKNTYDEWLKMQRVSEKSTEKASTTDLPATTYELWMSRQVKAKNRESPESENETKEAGASGQVLVSANSNDSRWREGEEITIGVTGRKSGKRYSTPVWFVFDEPRREVSLIPVGGRQSNWFRNIQSNPKMEISLGEDRFTIDAVPDVEPTSVQRVTERFSAKYGADQIEKFYPTRDAIVRFIVE